MSVEGSADVVLHRPLTPAQVLSWLPHDATPAQQDSAIQAHFKPSEIRWSKRPDTLHLPGHDKGRNLLDVNIPQYYREGFFSKDTLFHPELPGGRYGTAGDPVPYNAQNDHIITLILLLCFVMAFISISSVRDFIARQTKNFFYGTRAEITETTNEWRFQLFLVFLTGLQLALLYYFYTLNYISDTFVLASQYHLIAIYLAIILGYFLFKMVAYSIVNGVIFDSKRNGQWIKQYMFITSVEGVLFFPDVILQAYFNLSARFVIIYFTIALILVKILTIYKCFTIFFQRNVVSLQIILYLCALEIVPMLLLWRILGITANNLKINF